MCAAAVWQWCEKNPDCKWMCDANPGFHHETWMRDMKNETGSYFPYSDFEAPYSEDNFGHSNSMFEVTPVLESQADAILGIW